MNMQTQQPFASAAAMDLSCGYQYNPRSMMDYFHSCKSEYTHSAASISCDGNPSDDDDNDDTMRISCNLAEHSD